VRRRGARRTARQRPGGGVHAGHEAASVEVARREVGNERVHAVLHVQQPGPHACRGRARRSARRGRRRTAAPGSHASLEQLTLSSAHPPFSSLCQCELGPTAHRNQPRPQRGLKQEQDGSGQGRGGIRGAPLSQMRSNSVWSSRHLSATSDITVGGSCLGSPASTTHSAPRTCARVGYHVYPKVLIRCPTRYPTSVRGS